MTVKKMRSTSGLDVRVALTSGHVIIIGDEWQDVDQKFHSAAYSLGCVSDDMEVSKEVKEAKESGVLDNLTLNAEVKSKVRTIILKAIEDNNLKAFTKAGNPTAKFVRDEIGYTVENHIVSAVMASILEDGHSAPSSNPDEELRSDIT